MAGDFTFLKGNIETIILCALFNGDKYGYEIAKEIKDRTQNQYEIKQPTLYTYLKRLETQELILSYWGAESNGGRRRYYKLTDLGKLHCQTFMNEWQYHKTVMENLVDTSTVTETPAQEDVTQIFGTKQKRTRKVREVTTESLDEADEVAKRLAMLQPQTKSVDETEETSAPAPQEQPIQQSTAEFVEEHVAPITDNDQPNVVQSAPVVEEIVAQEPIVTAEESAQEAEQPAVEQIEQPVVDRFAVNQEDATSFLEKFELKAQEIANRPTAESTTDTGENYQHVLMGILGDQIDAQVEQSQVETAQQVYAEQQAPTLENVADKLAQQGVRMRIYNRTTAQYRSKLLVPSNKINCLTAWFTFLAMFILLAGLCLATLNTGTWPIFAVICGILFVVPVILTVIASVHPIRREKPNYNLKQLLILSGIISAVIILLSLGINILFKNIKLSAEFDKVVTQILLPSVLGLIFPIAVFIYDKCVNYFAE